MQDVLKAEYRKLVIDEILSKENQERKRESFKRFDVYNKRQGPYVEARLEKEFPESYSSMRKVLSINVAKRITDKSASLYLTEPKRTFVGNDGQPLSDEVVRVLENHYQASSASVKLLRANRTERYQNQCILQVVPVESKGIIDVRVFHPHQIDVIPRDDDPEAAFAYVVSSFDRSATVKAGDGKDQRIADVNDGENQKRKLMRFVWWTNEHNFITDGEGSITQADATDLENPIGMLPFIDICDEKENEFWVRKGNSVIDFALDFSVVLSDTANINRLQGYAQGVITSVDKPKDFRVGPNQFLWLQQDPNSTVQPSFSFVSPSPDMNASLELLDRLSNFFMSAEGVDPKTVNSKGETQSFSSGYERMLAAMEAFESSRSDIAKYEGVEEKLFQLFAAWHNVQGADTVLNPSLRGPSVPEGASVWVQYARPEMVQSKTEIEDSELKLLEAGLRSPVQALETIDGLDEATALAKLMKIDEHKKAFITTPVVEEGQALEAASKPAQSEQPEHAAPIATEKAADSALNGAQVSAMVEVVTQVAMGRLPRESAVSIIEKAFLVPRSEAEELIGSAGKGFVPATSEPQPSGEAA